MRRTAPLSLLVLSILPCGCSGPQRVSPAAFAREYAWVGRPQSMRDVTYLGQSEGKAYLRVRSMSSIGKTWSERDLYVELAELEPAARDALPKTAFSRCP